MAKIANTAFEARITNNEFDNLCNITGRYQESSADAECSAGILCKRGDALPCAGFTGVVNENAWYMNVAAGTDDVLYACNTYETRMVDGYYLGKETLGLSAPAGRDCVFTKIDFDGQSVYRFGIGNVNGAIGENKFFKVVSGRLVPAASAPSGEKYFKLRGTGNFVEGTSASFGYVDVVACL